VSALVQVRRSRVTHLNGTRWAPAHYHTTLSSKRIVSYTTTIEAFVKVNDD
jgi:hypothetical protein